MTSADRKKARINRILQEKQKKDALSIGKGPAEFKNEQAKKRLEALRTPRSLDNFEKNVYTDNTLPEDDISDEEYDQEIDKQAARAQGRVVPNEPAETPSTLTGEQAEASAKPEEAVSPESLQTAKKAPPGGLVQRMRSAVGKRFGRGGGAGGAIEGEAAATGGGGGNLVGRARIAAQEAIKNIGKTIAKQFTKAAIKAFFSNPYTWIVLGAIVLIFLVIVIPLGLLGQVGKDVSGTGKSWSRPTEPTKDATTIKQALKLGGEQVFISQNVEDGLDKVKSSVTKTKDEVINQNHPQKNEIVAKADLTLTSIDLLQSEKTDKNVTNFLNNLKGFLLFFENQLPSYPADRKTRFPVDNPTLIFNTDLHGGSYQRPEHVDSHGVYTAYDEGACDAFDIAVNYDQIVYPVFGGQIVEKSSDGLGGEKVVIKDGDYEVLIAHLTEVGAKQGDTVSINDPLGKPLGNHIHIEAIHQTTCLTTTVSDLIDFSTKDRAHDKIGGYIYDHFKTFFHLQ